jgi:hypothetical protein
MKLQLDDRVAPKLQESSSLLLRQMRDSPDLADISDEELVDLVCSESFLSILRHFHESLSRRVREETLCL